MEERLALSFLSLQFRQPNLDLVDVLRDEIRARVVRVIVDSPFKMVSCLTMQKICSWGAVPLGQGVPRALAKVR